MSGKKPALHRPSLAGHFDAPDDHMGHFGWLCGYSADAPFLDDALTRFTRLTTAQRAALGRIFLAAVLDRGNPPIPMTEAPGVAHLPLTGDAHGKLPFRLLHAKVALLGFKHLTEPGRWHVRLLVSTGNWTRQTMEESLDLIWRLDLPVNEAAGDAAEEDALDGQSCADIRGAWRLLSWLRRSADTSLLDLIPASPGALAEKEVRELFNTCARKANGRSPRFFESRRAPLLDQILSALERHGGAPRNYLALGSGFYEGEGAPGKELVPLTILHGLREQDLLTGKAEVDVFVNPLACQALAAPEARKALKWRGIHLRPAGKPEAVFGSQAHDRALHAKFLFGATAGSETFKNAWLYLGSGNLTGPGFLNKMSPSGGNLEAGVLLFLRGKFLKSGPADPERSERIISHVLPVQWNDEITGADALAAGGPQEERPEFPAPPLTWLLWDDRVGSPVLRAEDTSPVPFNVLDPAGKPCPGEDNVFQWSWARPALVTIRWQAEGTEAEAPIPVVDAWGRVAARELPALDTEEAWWQLAAFPLPPEEDEDDSGDADAPGPGDGGSSPAAKTGEGLDHPIRRMMELIENIAERQVNLPQADWVLWCLRLKQTLFQMRDCAAVAYFRDELGLDPLWPLLAPCFRPEFAENGKSSHGRRYEETLREVRTGWKVDGLPGLGEIGGEASASAAQTALPGDDRTIGRRLRPRPGRRP